MSKWRRVSEEEIQKWRWRVLNLNELRVNNARKAEKKNDNTLMPSMYSFSFSLHFAISRLIYLLFRFVFWRSLSLSLYVDFDACQLSAVTRRRHRPHISKWKPLNFIRLFSLFSIRLHSQWKSILASNNRSIDRFLVFQKWKEVTKMANNKSLIIAKNESIELNEMESNVMSSERHQLSLIIRFFVIFYWSAKTFVLSHATD